jgi:hypothetical protein
MIGKRHAPWCVELLTVTLGVEAAGWGEAAVSIEVLVSEKVSEWLLVWLSPLVYPWP